MIRAFRYAGSKQHIIEIYKKIENNFDLTKKIFIEPFVGSGTIFLNNSLNYKKFYINDKSKYIIFLWQGFKKLNYVDYLERFYEIQKKFGDIKNSKSAYYNFRKWFNENVDYNDIKYSPYLYLLTNSTINSMLRFGPNGMNQSFGNRLYFFDELTFLSIKKKLEKTFIYNEDYKKMLKDEDNLIYFLDPPYIETKSPGYIEYFDKKEHINFLNIISTFKKSIFIYTDTLTTLNNDCNFYKISLGKLNSIRHNKNQKEEYLFTNIENIKEIWQKQ